MSDTRTMCWEIILRTPACSLAVDYFRYATPAPQHPVRSGVQLSKIYHSTTAEYHCFKVISKAGCCVKN